MSVPSTVTSVTINPATSSTVTGECMNGDHDIKRLVRQGYITIGNEEILVGVAVWSRSLVRLDGVKNHDQENDDPIPWGLKAEDLKLPLAFDVKESSEVTLKLVCRYCPKTFAKRSTLIRHEQHCTVPGAPKHECNECPPDCLGAVQQYVAPPDGRKRNKGRPKLTDEERAAAYEKKKQRQREKAREAARQISEPRTRRRRMAVEDDDD